MRAGMAECAAHLRHAGSPTVTPITSPLRPPAHHAPCFDAVSGSTDVGYFDALTSSSFKTTPDGRRLFFPWGTFGHGYIIGSEPEFRRLQRQLRIYLIVALSLIVGLSWHQPAWVTIA